MMETRSKPTNDNTTCRNAIVSAELTAGRLLLRFPMMDTGTSGCERLRTDMCCFEDPRSRVAPVLVFRNGPIGSIQPQVTATR